VGILSVICGRQRFSSSHLEDVFRLYSLPRSSAPFWVLPRAFQTLAESAPSNQESVTANFSPDRVPDSSGHRLKIGGLSHPVYDGHHFSRKMTSSSLRQDSRHSASGCPSHLFEP